MTSEYEQEYSEQIKWFTFPAEWRLDKDDEEQLKANIEEGKQIINYLERRHQIGTKGFAPQV